MNDQYKEVTTPMSTASATSVSPPAMPRGTPVGGVITIIHEFLAFKLGEEEYGMDILRVQEIRS